MKERERILIVDDEKTILFALKTYFARDGHVVDVATSFDEALKLVGENVYGVAILDVQLGGPDGADGIAIAGHIRKHSSTTFVIILTALETRETELRAAEVGVHSMLHKPTRLAHVADVAFGLMRNTVVAAN